jgi:hypothetical protein
VTALGEIAGEVRPHGLLALGDQLVVAHGHHFGLFLEQTVFDALGGESLALRRQAALEAAHALLAPRCAEVPPAAAEEKLELAAELFAAMGHGRLRFELGPEGGSAHAEALHHAAGFLDKYGGRVPTRVPVDAFASGYCAAAASLAFPSDWGRFEAEEVSCAARGDRGCVFTLIRRPERPRFGVVITRARAEAAEPLPPPSEVGDGAGGAEGWASPVAALEADARGLIHAYGGYVALLPVSYTGQILFDTVHLIEKRSPDLTPVLEALLREAAQVGAFHLLGGMLASHGAGDDLHDRLEQLLRLCRALGWGALSAGELVPGRSLVLRCPVTPEGVYYTIRHGATLRRRLLFLQGTALAIMQLLHRVDFDAARPIGPDTYAGLFRSGPRLAVEETRSPLRGDAVCEARVEAIGG